MLKFWQFDNFENIEPELYWTNKEKELAKKIIKDHCKNEFNRRIRSSYFFR